MIMKNFTKKVTDTVKNSTSAIKNQAESLNQNIKDGSEDLNKKIQEGSETLNKNFKKPAEYNFLIFAFPIILILLAFIPMADWLLQVVRLVITCCFGYVLFYEYRTTKKREKVFYIAAALTVLFNPLVPFYVPGAPINIAAIVATCYLAYLTKIAKNSGNSVAHVKKSVKHETHAHSSHSTHKKH